MSATSARSGFGPHSSRAPGLDLRTYFWSDAARRIQIVLGLIWLLDGGLQFQSFMYSKGFPQSLVANAQGQANWIHGSILWAVKIANGDLSLWNTLFALVQVLIGLGLLWRPAVKPALILSFAWTLVVWWFGEGFGGIFAVTAAPLTGAPGGVLMYGLVGLLAWPNGRPGGLLGARGARIQWAILWIVMALLWLIPSSADPGSTSAMLNSVPSGIGFIDSLQNHFAADAKGAGVVIALVLAAITAVIGIGVGANWRAARGLLAVAIVLNALYWIIPQGLGGIFAGGATDPNAAPLFILLAAAMYPLVGAGAGTATPTLEVDG